LQKALNYSSEDPVLYDHLGDAYRQKGDTAKALEHYNQAVRLDPSLDRVKAKIKSIKKE
jgi:Flp pilus assembly protein TadD